MQQRGWWSLRVSQLKYSSRRLAIKKRERVVIGIKPKKNLTCWENTSLIQQQK